MDMGWWRSMRDHDDGAVTSIFYVHGTILVVIAVPLLSLAFVLNTAQLHERFSRRTWLLQETHADTHSHATADSRIAVGVPPLRPSVDASKQHGHEIRRSRHWGADSLNPSLTGVGEGPTADMSPVRRSGAPYAQLQRSDPPTHIQIP